MTWDKEITQPSWVSEIPTVAYALSVRSRARNGHTPIRCGNLSYKETRVLRR